MRKARLMIATALLVAAVAAVSATASTPGKVAIKNLNFPADSGVGFGSVWVLDHRLGVVYRIDPRTNRVRRIEVGESLCAIPTFGAGAVWVWGCDSNVTYEIDSATNRVVAKRKGIGPIFGAGSLWTNDPSGKVLRIDPKSGVVLATIDPGIDVGDTGGIEAFGGGSIWVAADNAVSRIDVATNKVTAVLPLPAWKPSGDLAGGVLGPNYGAFVNGKLWDSNAAGMYEIDAATNNVSLLPIALHPMPTFGDVPVVASNGSIWVRTGSSSVARIDPSTGEVIRRYPATGGGGGITVGFGSLWVANTGPGSVWREPIH
jgi:streptogramin lyase